MLPAYIANWIKLARQDRHLHPNVAIYYVTGQCNLNCMYCEDFGTRRNAINENPVPIEEAKHILRVIRSGTDALFLTGGEPLTHPQIGELVAYAKSGLRFRELTLISNGLLIDSHIDLLPLLDRLIISLDSTDPAAWSRMLGISASSAESILSNIESIAVLQKKLGFVLTVNAVISPESLPDVETLLGFCSKNRLLISFSPQSVNNWPRYELTTSCEYQTLISRLIALKKRGAPILGSLAYLKMLSHFEPYDCFPTLVPRIYPNGDLAYPCRPFEKGNNGQGGRNINLLDFQEWEDAWGLAKRTFGQPPQNCHSCFQQCYAEPSLMQSRPLTLMWEYLRYTASRKGKLTTYAPG
jgi:MoaA/NifB/PqqE/SkfB family radical SAM enzyme